MSQYAYLICVQASDIDTGEAKNNNKFYEMKENNDGTFSVNFGRIGSSSQNTSYSMSEWDKVYRNKTQKVRNGYIYKDITSLKSTVVQSSLKDVKDSSILKLLTDLQKYAKQSIIDNYTVTSESVTQAQIDEAQKIIDKIADQLKYKSIRNSEIDKNLIELYSIIPRKMKKVQDHILNGDGDKKKAQSIIQNEQDTLDVMRGQVSIQNTSTSNGDKTLEDVLGVKINKVTDQAIIDQIKTLMQDNSNRLKNVYEVIKSETQKAFEKQKQESIKHWTKLLWHGSRNENWLNILKTGLKIRPSCAVYTGSMFGNGVYFADKCQKSIGYTSSRGAYWTGGSSDQAFLAIYEVNTGMEYRIDRHTSDCYSMNYDNLKRKGDYDSLFAKGGIDLRNNEYIVYKESQCTIKYLVEIK
jgi:poly [ADP-ribose] polymerase 2/3/4